MGFYNIAIYDKFEQKILAEIDLIKQDLRIWREAYCKAFDEDKDYCRINEKTVSCYEVERIIRKLEGKISGLKTALEIVSKEKLDEVTCV